MAYLTHNEYAEMGGTLAASAFTRQEYKARQFLDTLTHGRVVGDSPVRDAVKHAMTALIDAQAADGAQGGREIASESNDGVSVSYAVTGPGGAYARRVQIVCDYLTNEATEAGTPLLYAGVDA